MSAVKVVKDKVEKLRSAKEEKSRVSYTLHTMWECKRGKDMEFIGQGFGFYVNPFPNDKFYTLPNRKFADDNFKLDENGRKFFKRVENTMGKGEHNPNL